MRVKALVRAVLKCLLNCIPGFRHGGLDPVRELLEGGGDVEALVQEDDGSEVVLVADDPPDGLVDGAEGLQLVPRVACGGGY